MLIRLIKADLKLYAGRAGQATNLLIFFILITSLFPLTLGADSELLSEISIGVIWVTALLTSVLSLSKIFEESYENGVLEQLYLTPCLLQVVVLAKIISHWLSTGLLISLVSPILSYMYNPDFMPALYLFISLFIGTMILSMTGVMGAALCLGVKRGEGVLVSLLVLPLYIPVLIFGSALPLSAKFGYLSDQFIVNFAVLICIFLITLPISIYASSISVKIALEE